MKISRNDQKKLAKGNFFSLNIIHRYEGMLFDSLIYSKMSVVKLILSFGPLSNNIIVICLISLLNFRLISK